MISWSEMVRQVVARAGDRCEYCRMYQAIQGATFHVEHIIPQCRGGASELGNLAQACPGCNLHKADRTEALDPDSNMIVSLFNPRKDNWHDHFRWNGYQVAGLTSVGKATIAVLDLNHARRLLIRKAEEIFGLFPPE